MTLTFDYSANRVNARNNAGHHSPFSVVPKLLRDQAINKLCTAGRGWRAGRVRGGDGSAVSGGAC